MDDAHQKRKREADDGGDANASHKRILSRTYRYPESQKELFSILGEVVELMGGSRFCSPCWWKGLDNDHGERHCEGAAIRWSTTDNPYQLFKKEVKFVKGHCYKCGMFQRTRVHIYNRTCQNGGDYLRRLCYAIWTDGSARTDFLADHDGILTKTWSDGNAGMGFPADHEGVLTKTSSDGNAGMGFPADHEGVLTKTSSDKAFAKWLCRMSSSFPNVQMTCLMIYWAYMYRIHPSSFIKVNRTIPSHPAGDTASSPPSSQTTSLSLSQSTNLSASQDTPLSSSRRSSLMALSSSQGSFSLSQPQSSPPTSQWSTRDLLVSSSSSAVSRALRINGEGKTSEIQLSVTEFEALEDLGFIGTGDKTEGINSVSAEELQGLLRISCDTWLRCKIAPAQVIRLIVRLGIERPDDWRL